MGVARISSLVSPGGLYLTVKLSFNTVLQYVDNHVYNKLFFLVDFRFDNIIKTEAQYGITPASYQHQ